MSGSDEKKINLNRQLLDSWQNTIAEFSRGSKRGRGKTFSSIVNSHVNTITSLWEIFNNDRQILNQKLLNHSEATTAYLLGFHLANCARVMGIWERSLLRSPSLFEPLKNYKQIDIIDFGCGTGASSQATVSLISKYIDPSIHVTAHLYDQNRLLLNMAEFGFRNLGSNIGVKTCKISLDKLNPSFFASETPRIITLGYIYNELAKNRRAIQFLNQLFASFAKSKAPTYVLLLEPAKKLQSQNAIELRNYMCELGFIPIYPCPSGQRCPLSSSAKDWCYSEFLWQRPQVQKEIDEKTGIKRAKLTTTGMLFFFGDQAKSSQQIPSVVIGRPQTSGAKLFKNQKERSEQEFAYLLCTPQGIDKIKPRDGSVILRGQILPMGKKNNAR